LADGWIGGPHPHTPGGPGAACGPLLLLLLLLLLVVVVVVVVVVVLLLLLFQPLRAFRRTIQRKEKRGEVF